LLVCANLKATPDLKVQVLPSL